MCRLSHHRSRTQAKQRKAELEELDAIGQLHDHAVPRSNASLMEATCKLNATLMQLRITNPA